MKYLPVPERDCQDESKDKDKEKEKKNQERPHRGTSTKLGYLVIELVLDQLLEKSQKKNCDPAVKVGLLNVQSMTNKTGEICQLIERSCLDIFLTTETWFKDMETGNDLLREASPLDFKYYHQPRGSRGGGVAIQFLSLLQDSGRITETNSIATFEYVATTLQHRDWDNRILFISLYRPPNRSSINSFTEEFCKFLSRKGVKSMVVAGDFNIPPEYLEEFCTKLAEISFQQHVDEPTHRMGHILDLVIARNVEISEMYIHDDGISDHYTLYFTARPLSWKKKCGDP